MPTAKKLPSGSWRCQVFSHYENVMQLDGTIKKKRIYKSFTCDIPGAKGKRIAEQKAAAWAAEKENAVSVENISLKEAASRYISMRQSVLSPRSIMEYNRIKDHDLQCIMNLKVATITQEDVQRAVNIDALKKSPKSVRCSHGFIAAVIRSYRPNFQLNTTLPKLQPVDLYIPTDAEIKRLISETEGTDMELPILLAAFGPMRRGEICALSSENISGNVVHVCKNMVLNVDKKWIIKAPKSYAGDRFIDYPDFVAQKWEGCTGRIVNLTPDNISNRFSRILKRIGLPHFRFHDLRHYSASIQHALGIPDSYIMQRGGWGNDGTLKAIYRHTLRDKVSEMDAIANNHFESLCNTKCNTKIKEP